ncbi:hypothetical protein BaRGS_00027346, partial [Batillaria attramentaria]
MRIGNHPVQRDRLSTISATEARYKQPTTSAPINWPRNPSLELTNSITCKTFVQKRISSSMNIAPIVVFCLLIVGACITASDPNSEYDEALNGPHGFPSNFSLDSLRNQRQPRYKQRVSFSPHPLAVPESAAHQHGNGITCKTFVQK